MPSAILIAFEYISNPLPGATIDLYHAISWCNSIGCSFDVLTDIQPNRHVDNLKSVVRRGIADSDLLSFYDRLDHIYKIRDHPSFLQAIDQVLSEDLHDDKLIIYYTGHGVQDSVVLPDSTHLLFLELRNYILQRLNSEVEIFWILDCCNPNGLHLPYKLNSNGFSLSPSQIQCVVQPILLITSSESNEKSVATASGSVFSRHLFKLLTEMDRPFTWDRTVPIFKNRNLYRLIGRLTGLMRQMHTGYTQTVSVYSSYVMDPIIWMWVGSNSDIISNFGLDTLFLRTPLNCTFKNPYDDIIMT